MRRAVVILAGSLLLAAPGRAAEYYVAVKGNDANSGTLAKPFRSLQKAASVMKAGDTCWVRGGRYFETVSPAASGTADMPITFQAYKGEEVTVSGADPVTGWRKDSGSIYAARMNWNLGKDNQVFVDGTMVYEARWPNKEDSNPMNPEAAKIDSGGDGFLISSSLPDGLPDDAWKGATIWVAADRRWSTWTDTVTTYSSREKKLTMVMPSVAVDGTWPIKPKNGEFYVVGKREMLDSPGEWYHDAGTQRLLLWAPKGDNPNRHLVTAKKRMLAFDLRGKRYIHLVGIGIEAATVDLEDAEHCVVERMRARYISHTRGGKTVASLGEKTGIFVTGSHNVIRDSEIAYSAGAGVDVGGSYNAVINCWIHDADYMGAYPALISVRGFGHLLSHNTLNDAGRDAIQGGGQQHVIEYNDVYRSGRIAHDEGLIYQVSNDGDGTEIHHNWFHDNAILGEADPHELAMGLYLDNFTSNYLLHHNVMWGTGGRALNLNKPSLYNLVLNNTVIGNIPNWGRWPADSMFGDRIINNLIAGKISPHPELLLLDNIEGLGSRLNQKNFQSALEGVDAGVVLMHITDGFNGSAPDLGAYESGQPPWKPGHDFAHPPHPEYHLTRTPLSNQVRNGGFERYRALPTGDEELNPWVKTHARAATLVRGRSGILNPIDDRDSFIGSAVKLSGGDADGIEQAITGLLPNTRYVFAAWVKVDDAEEVRIGVRSGGADLHEAMRSRKWQMPKVEFTTGDQSEPVTVYVLKIGAGAAYGDEFGLVPAYLTK